MNDPPEDRPQPVISDAEESSTLLEVPQAPPEPPSEPFPPPFDPPADAQQAGPPPPPYPLLPPPPSAPETLLHPALSYYEAQMRDHAAAYAMAAAGAAWAAAQIASSVPPLYPPYGGPVVYGPPDYYYGPSIPMPQHSGQSHDNHHHDEPEPHEPEEEDVDSRHRKRADREEAPRRILVDRHRVRRRRRRWHSDNDSSSSGSSFYPQSMRKKKPRNDDSLLGKTAVAALYEWCGKRQTTPILEHAIDEEEFTCTISIDTRQVGAGRGRTKASAKQAAARAALSVLVPGVVFDAATGILVELLPPTAQYCDPQLEDLAPNLAMRLAIGEQDNNNSTGPSKRRARNVYPGSTTTSASDDEESYYATRGASVCSALLHAMIQIDARILGPPDFAYQAAELPMRKRKVASHEAAAEAAAHPTRGPFTCTARLRLKAVTTNGSEEEEDAKPAAAAAGEKPSCQVLEGTGTGGTKREARHVACAKLLALLFPECATMVEVRAAAEAAREKYAAERALRQQEANLLHALRPPSRIEAATGIMGAALARMDDAQLPDAVQKEYRALLGMEPLEAQEDVDCVTSDSAFRQLSRQKQIDSQVDVALQQLNERDEEGRTLPEELVDDDVGRTMLRRALPEDLPRIKKLFAVRSKDTKVSPRMGPSVRSVESSSDDEEQPELASQLWSSSSIVLLLCRAIAAYEDPPLGCAVLSLGFSMESGRLLRIARLASETHLPRERFVECLQTFAGVMNCTLDVGPGYAPQDEVLPSRKLRRIVESHVVPQRTNEPKSTVASLASRKSADDPIKRVSSPLQSVQEESEVSESSAEPKRVAKRHSSKSSKRSRVA